MKKTPLNALHRELGAKMVDFGGWDLPVQYSSLTEEHMAVRERVGLFDVSHMGELFVSGPGALETIQKVTTNDASKLKPGQIHYSGLMTEKGTFVDDILVHRFDDERFFLCVNAGNQDKDFEWIKKYAVEGSIVEDKGPETAQIAIQGPLAAKTIQKLTDLDLSDIKYYWFAQGDFADIDCLIAHTGYTGEDGFELYCTPDKAPTLWQALTASGQEFGLLPCGLGARDTLRLEAGMALYGNDIDDTTTPLEAGLGWIVKLGKEGGFLGRDVLARQKEEGPSRKLTAFELLERGIARHGYPCFINGEKAGEVTSGTQTPFLKKSIGLAYLPAEASSVGTEFAVEIRNRKLKARVIQSPPYKRPQ